MFTRSKTAVPRRSGPSPSAPVGRSRRARSVSLAGTTLLLLAGDFTDAAELLVVERANCPYCARFDAEIADAWPNTDEGRRAPLRRVDLDGAWPADLADVEKAVVTPTFVLLDDDGNEVERLVGYRGDAHFWFLIGELLAQLDAR